MGKPKAGEQKSTQGKRKPDDTTKPLHETERYKQTVLKMQAIIDGLRSEGAPEADILEILQQAGAPSTLAVINEMIQRAIDIDLLKTSKGKQELARAINDDCRRNGYCLAHPETKAPCILLAINDEWGGKFTLEDRKTKKRSNTTRDIRTMQPFTLIPIPKTESESWRV
jgi:hypothetical protein